MRIFYAFLVIVIASILFMLPITEMIYDFRTDQRIDRATTITAAGVTTGNSTLFLPVYDNDTSTINITSQLSTDAPFFSTYNTTSRLVTYTGLTANTTRTMSIAYDVDAIGSTDAINVILDRVPFVWLLVVIAFAPAALFAIFTGRV